MLKHLSPQQERVAELLAAGCSVSEVKGATGFSDGYISQLSTDVVFREAVQVLSSARVEKAIEKQDAYDDLEGAIIRGISERVVLSDMSELSRALDVVARNNPRRAKGILSINGEGSANVSVTLNLPEHVMQPLHLETNSRNEVINVGGQSLLPLTQKDLQSKLRTYSETEL